jgi:uncharacterized protein (DUF1501 family)
MSGVARSQDEQTESVSRRDFLRVGSLSVVGLSVAEQAASSDKTADRTSCIFVLMTGGPSPLETFDPKPDAPAEIRGPLKAISTAVPGTALSESLPRLAQRADKFAILRSLQHQAAPIHETGLQLLQTGRLARGEFRSPSFGSAVASILGSRGEVPPFVVLPRLLGHTGVNAYQGQQAGFLGAEYDPLTAADDHADDESLTRATISDEPESVRQAYGENRFGRLCLQARELVEHGVRCVTVNLFDRLTNQLTWDCHGRGPWAPATLFDYRDVLCPQFDRALAALFDDLEQRGLWDDTLVVAVGEFGRTPHVNEHGGRDHWPGVWSALVAGGGVQGGQVIGASDSHAAAPADRPIEPGELTATIYHSLGLDLETPLTVDGEATVPLVEHQPIAELFSH